MSTITLVTGTPRSGKTLWAVEQLNNYILADDLRPLYSDIKGFSCDVVQPSPDDWRTVPDGSVIFYDECQMRKIFSSKFKGESDIILEMTMHGHRGIDIYFITQGTRYMNTDIFPLVNRHVHVHNAFRSKRGSKLYLFDTVQTSLSKSNLRDAADVKTWRYPIHLYDVYKSSSVHNKESYVSSRIKNAMTICFGVLCMIVFYAYQAFNDETSIFTNSESVEKTLVVDQPAPASPALAAPPPPVQLDEVQRSSLSSAPTYDPFARVAMVSVRGSDCIARNQYGEILDIAPDRCRFFSDNPSFMSSARPVDPALSVPTFPQAPPAQAALPPSASFSPASSSSAAPAFPPTVF